MFGIVETETLSIRKEQRIRGAVMINAFVFYVEEMVATLILFTALFIVIRGAILVLFVLDQAYRVVFDWSEMRLRSFGHFASRVYETYHPADNQLASVGQSVFVVTALSMSYISACVDSGLQLRTSLIKTMAPLWARVVEKIATFLNAVVAPGASSATSFLRAQLSTKLQRPERASPVGLRSTITTGLIAESKIAPRMRPS
jgi:hypothetical protein